MAIARKMTLQIKGRDIRLLIFDMDGVLVSTSSCHARAYHDLWNRLGIDGPDYQSIAGRKTSEVVAEVTASLLPSEQQLQDWIQFKQRRARDCIDSAELCYPDTVDCLRTLAQCGVTMALGTAASAETVRGILQRYRLQDYFESVVTADDTERGKPAPDVYLSLIERHQVLPAASLVVEDSVAGLQAALAAGACVVSVRTGAVQDHAAFLGSFTDLAALRLALGVCA